MANTLRLKRSAVSGRVPATTDLSLGEVAINTNDGRVFLKKDDGTEAIVEVIADDGAGKVGIGTSSPISDAVLTLSSDSDTALFFRRGASTNQDGAIRFEGGAFQFLNGANSSTVAGLSERMRIDSSGRVLVGTSSSKGIGSGTAGRFQVASTTHTIASITAYSNSTLAGTLVLGKSRGTSVGSNTIVQDGDNLGEIRFAGADGSDLVSNGAKIVAQVDGTPGSNSMPSRLVFSTTASGASTSTERMRIDSSGNVGIGTPLSSGPTNQLHIYDGGAANDRAELKIESFRPIIRFQDRSTSSASSEIVGDSGLRFNVSTPVDDDTQLTERMRIDNSGRLLLGTTTEGHPSADNLTIADSGTCGLTFRSGTSGDGNIFFSDGTSGDAEYRGAVRYFHSSDSLVFWSNASERMRISSTGKVTITGASNGELALKAGSASGNDSIQFQNSAGSTRGNISYDTDNNFLFVKVNQSERLRINSSGDVGIGTTSPGKKLDVQGSIRSVGTSATIGLPVGTTAQRPGSPAQGDLRFNSTDTAAEIYDGSAWSAVGSGGGATGGGSDQWAVEHDNTITASYTISSGKNVISAGPLTVNSGAVVTVPSGSNWVIV